MLYLFLFLALIPMRVIATTPEATPTATPKAAVNAQLEELKDRLATKVAQLRDIVRRAVSGTIKTISISSATVETKTKDIKIELADDIIVSQLINGKRTVLSVEDLTRDDPVTVFGSYDATLDLLKAKVIFIESTRIAEHLSGTVIEIDRDQNTAVVETSEGRKVTVDIEKATKTIVWTKDGGLAKGGFSKITTGDTVHVVGVAVPKKENTYTAVRILDIGNLSGAAPTITAPAASPSATPKATPKPKPTV